MMTKKIYLFFILLFSSVVMFAQLPPETESQTEANNDIDLFHSSAYSGNVTIQQSSSIKKLLEARMSMLKKQKGFEGYRIRIFAKVGSGARTQAQDIRIEFLEKFNDLEAYLQYNSPNWEIHVGDFRTRMEAMQRLTEIKKEYPQAFVVKDYVKFPKLRVASETESEK